MGKRESDDPESNGFVLLSSDECIADETGVTSPHAWSISHM
jgi:hypothetical protein